MNPPARLMLSLACLLAAPALAQDVAPVVTDPQLTAYEEFSTRYLAGDYAGALPLAQQVVELTAAKRDSDLELPVAYNNLGATQLRLGDLDAAEASYARSLELLETTQGISSRRMIAPLTGLGNVLAARDQHARAAEHRARAIAISRRADGLFNLGQLELIESVVQSYLAIGNLQGVDNERRYAAQLTERNYGYADARMLKPLAELAVWYEQTRRYGPARAVYLRMRDIAEKEGSNHNETLVSSLLGIGRTYRLQFTVDPESLIDHAAQLDPVTGQPVPWLINPDTRVRLDRGGLAALQSALKILTAAADPPPRLLVNALLELGDWYVVANRWDLAQPQFVAAWHAMPAALDAGEIHPLVNPRLVFYRPPEGSARHRDAPADLTELKVAELEIDVDAEGRVTAIRSLANELSEYQLAQLHRSYARALFSPRFEDGTAVATTGVRVTGEWFNLITTESASAPAGR